MGRGYERRAPCDMEATEAEEELRTGRLEEAVQGRSSGPGGWITDAQERFPAWSVPAIPRGRREEFSMRRGRLKKMSAVERARTFDKMLDLRDGPDASVAMRACELLSHYSDGRPMAKSYRPGDHQHKRSIRG